MRLSLALAFCAAALALGACGFTPLYATGGVSGPLQAVAVTTPNDRTGFLLKQSLQDELALSPGAGAPRYTLDCQVTERRIARGVRVNNVANRYEINLTVAYRLIDAASGKAVLTGAAPVIVNYDSLDPPYAGVVAAQNGDERAAQQAAVQIRLALSRFFAGRPAGAPGIVETPQGPQGPQTPDSP